MSFSAVPREARSFSSHDIWGLGFKGAVFLEEEDGTVGGMELAAITVDVAEVEEANVETGRFVDPDGKDSITDSQGGGLGLFRTSLRALLSTATIGANCWSDTLVGFTTTLAAVSGLEVVFDVIFCGCGSMAWKPRDLNPGGNVVIAALDGMAEAGMGTSLDSLGRAIGMWILRFTVIGRFRPFTTSSVKGMADWIVVEAGGSEKMSFSSVFQAELVLLIGELFFSGVKVLRTDFWGVGGENIRLRT